MLERDLGELRIELDQMTERITTRFKDRLRFPANSPVYKSDGVQVVGRTGVSFLEFAIEGLEAYHASLGRFIYPDQYPVLGLNLPPPGIERAVVQPEAPKLRINISGNLIPFYVNLVTKYCKPGDDPDSYGQTVFLDAELIQMIHERVNIGRYVAYAKGKKDPYIYRLRSDREALLNKLKDRAREEALIRQARERAVFYELNPDMIEEAFRWMIDQTLEIEIAYIQVT